MMFVTFFRLTSFTSSTELLSLYRVGLATETDWLTTMQHQVSLQPELTGDENDARLQLQPIMVCTIVQVCSATAHSFKFFM